MQPAYLPWLGYFDRIWQSDLHVVLDHVQFEKNSFTNRNKVRTQTGWSWLTLPVETSGRFRSLKLQDVVIARDSHWRRKHLGLIETSYGRAVSFQPYVPFLRDLYTTDWQGLAEIARHCTEWLLRELAISTPLVRSSDLSLKKRKSELVLEICELTGATIYISGPFGRDYLKHADFENAGIELLFHDYRHPEYSQVFPGFEPYMSAIDLLFNHGLQSRAILIAGQELSRV
jgi:hypothetical protein